GPRVTAASLTPDDRMSLVPQDDSSVNPLDSDYPTRTFGGDRYIRDQFPEEIPSLQPFGNLVVGRQGCIGLGALRAQVPPSALSRGDTALAWFDDPKAALAFYRRMARRCNCPLLILAIQGRTIPNIGHITPSPGRIYPKGGRWKVPPVFNYATWHP